MFHSRVNINTNRRYSARTKYDRKRGASVASENPPDPSRASNPLDNPDIDEENQLRGSTNQRHPNRTVRKSDFQTVLLDLRGYLNNDRDDIDLTIDKEEGDDDDRHPIFGSTLLETLRIHWGWVSRLVRFLGFYLIGIAFYSTYEGWSLQDCCYFITQSVTTLGYGNITPTTRGARMFTIFYIYTGILIAFSLLNEISQSVVLFMRSKYKKPMKLNKFQVFVRNLYNCALWIIIIAVIPLFGSVVFKLNEGWSDPEAMYFSVITATSVGYGDLQPQKSSSIWFNIFYILFSVSLTALALDKISSFKRHLDQQELWQVLDDIDLSKPLIDAINAKEGRASSAEYILHMLQLEGKLNYADDILRWKRRFEEFDLDKDGFLTLADVEAYNKGMRRQSLLDGLHIPNSPSPTSPTANDGDHHNGREAKVVNLAGQPQQAKKRSILVQFTEETKDIFLETIGMKQPPSYRRKTAEPDQSPVTINPMAQARKLRRASNISTSSSEDFAKAKRPKRHTTMGMGMGMGDSMHHLTDSGIFPKIEMVDNPSQLHDDQEEEKEGKERGRSSSSGVFIARKPFSLPRGTLPMRSPSPTPNSSSQGERERERDRESEEQEHKEERFMPDV